MCVRLLWDSLPTVLHIVKRYQTIFLFKETLI